MYIFDDEVIHDSEAMWDLAISFKINHSIWSNELEKLKQNDFAMLYDGILIFKHSDEKYFKNAVLDYKKRVEILENMIKFDLADIHCKYSKYVNEK